MSGELHLDGMARALEEQLQLPARTALAFEDRLGYSLSRRQPSKTQR
jgi:hypothetical protein